ncbi:hypothetical protein HDV03_001321 [Kappamyces sp. JEL0829]|nr:hypothetical protein HDV03_001321 [Kappamyces sp. JEL0829]
MSDQLPPSPLQVTKSILKKRENSVSSLAPGFSSAVSSTPASPAPRSHSVKLASPKKKKKKLHDKQPTAEGEYDSDAILLSPSTESPTSTTSPSSPGRKKKKMHVISPLTGEKLHISSSDLLKEVSTRSSKRSPKSSDSEGRPAPARLEQLSLQRNYAPDEIVLSPLEKESDLLFVAEGNGFNPKEGDKYRQELQASSWNDHAPQSSQELFAERFQRRRKKVTEFCLSLHTGMVVTNALLLPTTPYTQMPISPRGNCTDYPPVVSVSLSKGQWPLPLIHCDVFPLTTRGYTPSLSQQNDGGLLFSFLLFYSPNAYNCSLVFQILSSICVLGTWEKAVLVGEAVRQGRMRRLYAILAWASAICAIVSFGATVVMIWYDTNLYYSVAAGSDAYGNYGEKNWFYDQASIRSSALIADMDEWAICNAIRSICGVLTYLFFSLVPDPAERLVPAQPAQPPKFRPSSSSSTIRGVLPV